MNIATLSPTLVAAAIIAAANTAHAASPTLSGSYTVNYTSTCPALLQTMSDPNTSDLQNIFVIAPGSAATIVGVATFVSSSPKVSFTGRSVGTGGLLQFQGTTISPYNTAFSVNNASYSSTATTIQLPFLESNNPTFNAFYTFTGSAMAVRSVAFSNTATYSTGAACIQSGTLSR